MDEPFIKSSAIIKSVISTLLIILLLCLALNFSLTAAEAIDKADAPQQGWYGEAAAEATARFAGPDEALESIDISSLRSSHLLRPGDVLDISVHEHPEFMIRLRVDTDGSILFPLCGRVLAAGKTAGQISGILSKKLQNANIAGAQVFVFVSTYTPRYIYVFGEIRGQDSKALEIPPEGRMTAMQAISGVGGFTPKANLRKVFVLRQDKNGKNQKIPANIAQIMAQSGDVEDVELKPDDTVIVPPASPVSVLGLVNTPGAFEIDTSHTVTAAEMISRAGGFKDSADRDQTLLLRGNSVNGAGGTTSYIVPVGQIMRGEISKPISIEPGDTIIARPKDKVFVLGQVRIAGAFDLNPDTTMTITRCIAMAGGFTNKAAEDTVLLIRNGQVTSINLRAALRKDGDLSIDQDLMAGDIVYVPESRW